MTILGKLGKETTKRKILGKRGKKTRVYIVKRGPDMKFRGKMGGFYDVSCRRQGKDREHSTNSTTPIRKPSKYQPLVEKNPFVRGGWRWKA